jgi:aerobic carbon-monoxide dehydrogenase small subunit
MTRPDGIEPSEIGSSKIDSSRMEPSKTQSERSDYESDRAKIEIALTVNGERRTARAFPMERLLDVLRHQLGLTGAKEGCGEGECGSCSVLVDGRLGNSCLVPVLQAQGTNIVTIEGLATGPQLHALQQAFLECNGAQCGICTPGMILAASHLLSRKPAPTLAEIQEGLSGNLCRCTGYVQIFEAVAKAARATSTL